jgi:hypothetical protein
MRFAIALTARSLIEVVARRAATGTLYCARRDAERGVWATPARCSQNSAVRRVRQTRLCATVRWPSRNCHGRSCAQARSMPEAAREIMRGRRAAPRH